jgi:hypothetical protein
MILLRSLLLRLRVFLGSEMNKEISEMYHEFICSGGLENE